MADIRSLMLVAGEPVHLGRHPLMTEDAAREALAAAVSAYGRGRGAWPMMSVADRIACFEAFIPRMVAARERVVRSILWEIGKPLPDAEKEFDRTVDYIRDTIAALKELDRSGSRFVLEEGFIAQIRRSPLGVVLCMGPYNYPLNETFATLVPAMIMGNTVVLKSPKLGVLLYEPLLDALAGSFPPGVVNVIHGDGPTVIGPIMTSGAIDVLAFIGSARVGSLLKHQHPKPNRLRSVLGLEAKNTAIVLPDADLDETVKECITGAFSYSGQRCTAIKLIFAHERIADAFVAKLSDAAGDLSAGMPWEPGVKITPLPEAGKPEWLMGLAGEAVAQGARIANPGGGTIDRSLLYPALLYPCTTAMRIAQIEQFGPVLPIVPYREASAVLDFITDSPYGQQASIFGSDPDAIAKLIDPLVNQVCRVNLNSQCQRGPDKFPFNGRKDSAEGTLSVSDALRVFSIRSLVATKATPRNQAIVSRIVSSRSSTFLSTDFIF
jgi:glyceraldehyde-3-phosphate dehydrogenase (NADP+)